MFTRGRAAQQIRFILAACILALLVAGCSQATPVEQAPLPTNTPVPTAVVATPTPEPQRSEAQDVVEDALADLQGQQGIRAQEIVVQEVTATEFSDASLGVPEPGKLYAQVLTPGYVIRLAVGDQVYIYHGNSERVVLAAQETSQAIAVPGDQSAPPRPGRDDPRPGRDDPRPYQRVEFADTGLSAELPVGWLRLEPEWVWTPAVDSGLLIGVRWADLQPPQEAEPALLPSPSQIMQAEPIELSWASGQLFTVEVYGPATQGSDAKAPVQSVEMHAIVVIDANGTRRAFDLYAAAPDAEQMAAQETVLRHLLDTSTLAATGSAPIQDGTPAQEPPGDWVAFRDDRSGLELYVPADWAWKELPADTPGMPDDWPVVRIVHFYPQAWDAEINRSGPPDPTAKVVVSPVQMEVLIGPEEQFRRVYPEPTQREEIEINGLPVTVEKEILNPMSLTRYVFRSPEDAQVYVTLTDALTGFPDRLADNEAIAEQASMIVQTARFVQ